MVQCAYTHPTLALYGPDDAYEVTEDEHCWVSGAKAFEIDGKEEYFCLFHGLLDKTTKDGDWTIDMRGAMQASLLMDEITKWLQVNGNRPNDPLAFVLPGLKCGELELDRSRAHTFKGSFIVEGAEFSGDLTFPSGFRFENMVNFKGTHFKGEANFSGDNFKMAADFSESSFKLADFTGAKFQSFAHFTKSHFTDAHFKNSIFQDADFTGATIESDADFRDGETNGKFDLSGVNIKKLLVCSGRQINEITFNNKSTINGTARFDGARIRSGDFSGAAFQVAHFRRVHFQENATFYKAKFTEAIFDQANFGLVKFDQTRFERNVQFHDATFNSSPVFDNVVCGRQMDFQSAKFQLGVHFRGVTSDSVQFNDITLLRPSGFTSCVINTFAYTTHAGEQLTFNRCRQMGGIPGRWVFQNQDCSKLAFIGHNFSRVRFMGADVNGTRFDSCTWPKGEKDKYIQVFEHYEILKENDTSKIELLGSLYRQLKNNQEADRNYVQAGEFHYREQEIRRRMLKRMGGRWLDRFMLRLYRCVGDYGESYPKLFFAMVASLLGTGLGVTVAEWRWSGEVPDNGCDFYDYYCNVIAKLPEYLETVVLGIIPSGLQREALKGPLMALSKLLIVAEGLILLALATLFVMAVRRRFRR